MGQLRSIAEVYGLQSQNKDQCIALTTMLEAITKVPAANAEAHWQSAQDDQGYLVASAESVPVVIIINELLTNAIKHSQVSVEDREVTLNLEVDEGGARLYLSNGPNKLPPGFDFETGGGLGTGLELVRSLIPTAGAELRFLEQGHGITTEQLLRPPEIEK